MASAVPGAKNGNGCLVSRSDPSSALGASDGDFFSLGEGGYIVLGFSDTTFDGGEAGIYEVTFDRESGHDEAIDVYSVLDDVETFVTRIINSPDAVGVATIFSAFDSLKFVDATVDEFGALTVGTTSFDGFDVDSVSVSPIPLPAAGFLLIGGLAGLGMMRRKQKS